MNITDDNMTQKEMLEKIAELDYSQNQLRDLNAEMRHWLDLADEEIATLRSEDAALRKQVKALEKIISESQQVEAEPCGSLLADDIDRQRCNEKKMQTLETESTMTKEQNKKLTAELKSLQQERERDKMSLSKMRLALQTLECGVEKAQLGLQHRDEVIHQKDLQLKHSEEMVEEYSSIIKDLRLTNQELRKQLEERQDEASFAGLYDGTGDQEGSLPPPLCLAEEIKLCAYSAEEKTSVSDSFDPSHEEAEAEEPMKPSNVTVDRQTKRFAGILVTGLLVLFVLNLTIFVFVVSRSCAENTDFFSINTLWNDINLILRPYCGVHHGALPPV